ncbi:hypothetical protein [Sideroxydans lithotrophicus]|uniref:Uncharacterized protein n=1 Tax=Sideroxydans lithotrophicus (strain ES-1) TaxID=580332 RepID=D5CQU9_SIDLE|nr:hypothetical protein [Sideroxydans lithotrophicus]ADE11335.1 conserved hypothetical protein [Sideroxydans lithotrophicus ES-1]
MKRLQSNPWAKRFELFLDKETIRRHSLVVVPPLIGLRDESTETACLRMEQALKTVFYPTNQCVDVLLRLVDKAFAHCLRTYDDENKYLAGIYAKNPPLLEFEPPLLVTGLAGTGKTEIGKGILRILLDDGQVVVGQEHSPFPLKKPWYVTVHAKAGPLDVLKVLANCERGSSDLVERCRKIAFRDGVPLLMADEFQFATGSSSANARVTQMLLSLGYIGIPWVYNANFTLVRRLLKRPEEDLQRILSDWIILQPDPPSSMDWQETLRIQKNVAPDILYFDPVMDASKIHEYTAGRKRATKELFVRAMRAEHPRGGVVDMAAIKRTYHSQQYAGFRAESEILANQAITNCPDKKRPDLWCPLPLSMGTTVEFAVAAKERRNAHVADAEIRSALSGNERDALREIERKSTKPQKKHGEVVPLRRKAAPTAEDLKRNANWFKDQI